MLRRRNIGYTRAEIRIFYISQLFINAAADGNDNVEVINMKFDMRYDGICDLIECDENANNYFHSLDSEVQKSLMARGAGVNTLEELKNFAEVVRTQD